ITAGVYFLLGEKYAELKPDLFLYQPLADLVPGLEAPNQSELLPYQIISGLLLGFGWIFVGTIIAPSKKFFSSSVLFLLTTILIIVYSISSPDLIAPQHLFAFVFTILAVIIAYPKKVLKLMKTPFGEYIRLSLILSTVTMFGLFFYNKKSMKLNWTINKKMEQEEKMYPDRVALDMNGDGIYEMLVNPVMADDYEEATDSAKPHLTLYDSEKNIIARTPEWFGSAPNASHLGFVTPPISCSLNDFVQIDVIAGPHQTETMFLKLKDDLLLPICKVENPKNIDDCLFYNSSGELGVEGGLLGGLGGNNKLGVVEYVDEYPPDKKELGDDIENMISEVFGNDATEAIKIAQRETGDKGSRVAWSIYIFNGEIFELQTGENYDEYFDSLKENYDFRSEAKKDNSPNLIKKSKMSKESVEYTELTRNFWTDK
ncbi:hypothetical protein KKC08_01625, partial [Patescibacteria group bacterium]|nr:hypothetical protein [Patescibacteria group bacterium]